MIKNWLQKIVTENYNDLLKSLIKFNYSNTELPLKYDNQILLTYQSGFPDKELFDALINTLISFWENSLYFIEYTASTESIILKSEFWWIAKGYKMTCLSTNYDDLYISYEDFFDSSNNNLIFFSESKKWCIIISWNEDLWFIGWDKEYIDMFKKYYPDYLKKINKFKEDWSEYHSISSYLSKIIPLIK